MPDEPKPTLEQYVPWLSRAAGITLDERISREYNITAIVAHQTCQKHSFFVSFDRTLADITREYGNITDAQLFYDTRVELVTKSFDSALNKSYRENVILNYNFPRPPTGGWLLPQGWLGAFDDIVRCRLICRYLDGPQFVAERLDVAAKTAGLESEYKSVQHDRGYYAYHFYVKIPNELLPTPVTVEIQLTTQLQELVYDLTHGFYEELRIQERAAQQGDAWKWEFKTIRFKAGYLSHTLHLLEGLIAEVRGERPVPSVAEEKHEHTAEPQAAEPAGAIPPSDPEKGSGGGT